MLLFKNHILEEKHNGNHFQFNSHILLIEKMFCQ